MLSKKKLPTWKLTKPSKSHLSNFLVKKPTKKAASKIAANL
jgi:hypothetical protein